jgi:hypothetical protein
MSSLIVARSEPPFNSRPLLTATSSWFTINVIKYGMDLPNCSRGAHWVARDRRRVQSGALNRIRGRRKDAHKDGGKTRAVSAPVYGDDIPWMLREGGSVVGLKVYALSPFFYGVLALKEV